MKSISAILTLVALFAFESAYAFGASPPMVDGLRLGATSTEVLLVLHAQGQRPHIFPRPCLRELLAEHKRIVSTNSAPGRCVAQIFARYAKGDLLLFFDEALPKHPGISVLTSIALNYPTGADAISRVVNEAGPPNLTDGKNPWVVAMWCFGFVCRDMDSALRNRSSGPVLLVHKGSGLTLEETRYRHALDAALARYGVEIDNN